MKLMKFASSSGGRVLLVISLAIATRGPLHAAEPMGTGLDVQRSAATSMTAVPARIVNAPTCMVSRTSTPTASANASEVLDRFVPDERSSAQSLIGVPYVFLMYVAGCYAMTVLTDCDERCGDSCVDDGLVSHGGRTDGCGGCVCDCRDR